MSFFERQCAPDARIVSVLSQGDEPFRSQAQNQCGWCAVSLAARSSGIAAAYAACDDEALRAIHTEALIEGSTRRAEAQAAPGANASGENVDNAALIGAATAADAPAPVRFLPFRSDTGSFVAAELNVPLRDMSFYPAYEVDEWFTRIDAGLQSEDGVTPRALSHLSVDDLHAAIADLPVGQFIVIGRFHEAFAAYRSSEGRWLVLDSHVRAVSEMEHAGLRTYINMMLGGDAYSLIVAGRGTPIKT